MMKKPSQKILEVYKTLVSSFFTNSDGEPFQLTDGQADIFRAVYNQNIKRTQIETTTQYGKSIVIALASLLVARRFKKKVAIIAPTDKQAGIIMDYIIEHLFDNSYFTSNLIDVEGLEKIKTQRARDKIVWADGAEIRTLSVGAKQVSAKGLGIMGFHADLIITDESALIPDEHYSKITRMLGGNLKKSKLVKIGNPFFRNHFFKTHEDPNYYHIWIDWQQAVREGRLTLEYVEEQRSSMTPEDFGVMYAVLFPDALSDDALFNFEIIDKAKIIKDFKITEWKVAGLDLSRGGKDATVLTFFEIDDHNLRVHKQVAKIDTSDSIQVANWVIDLHKEMKFEALGYDALGLGGPVGDYLYNLPDLGFDIVEYKAGTKAIDPAFANIKSQLLFALRTWCERGQADLSACHGQMFVDLLGCKKKRLSDRAMKVEDPTDSPDYMDSLLAGLFVVWGSNIPNITVQQ